VASASFDLNYVMEESLARILGVMGCEIGSIHLLDESKTLLRLAAWQGTPAEVLPEIETMPLGQGVAGRVVVHDGPLVVPAIEMEPYAVPSAGRILAGHAYIGAPMWAKGKVVGVLSVIGPIGRRFSAEEVCLLASIADQVGVAVENAQLYRQAEALAVAEERQRLAREIHDTLAQGLTGIKLQLDAVESALELQKGELALERLNRARQLADQSLAEARRSVWALRSKSLEGKKLANALRDSVQGLTTETGLAVTFEVQDELPQFPIQLKTDLLRVAQEAAMNAVKHADAKHLTIRLKYEANKIELQIKDDGRGFLVGHAGIGGENGSGFGLIAMRERIARHGGTLQIDSHPQRGTCIIASVESGNPGA
jgi:signal transduction histidine kinase